MWTNWSPSWFSATSAAASDPCTAPGHASAITRTPRLQSRLRAPEDEADRQDPRAEGNEADQLPWQAEIREHARGNAAHDRDHAEQHGRVVCRQPRLRLRHLTILVRAERKK